MAAAGLDAIVALVPENAFYLSGEFDYIARHWRIPGLQSFALGADGSGCSVGGDFGGDPTVSGRYPKATYAIWTESLDLRGVDGASLAERIRNARPGGPIHRPAQFDEAEVFGRVADAIRAVAPNGGRIGLDTTTLTQGAVTTLAAALPNAHFELVDWLLEDLRAIKDDDEIGHLRIAAELTDVGLLAAIQAVGLGRNAREIDVAYYTAIMEQAGRDPRHSQFREAEGNAQIGIGRERPTTVQPGTAVKFDMQVDVAGYHSDIGRTVAIEPTREQRELGAAAEEALGSLIASIRPGVPLASVYAAGQQAMIRQGFANYSRGHLGHSVGMTQNFEEGPFISPDEQRLVVENMVLSVEIPYYLFGVGAFQFERMLRVTATGVEMLDSLPLTIDRAAWDGVQLRGAR